MRRYPEHAQGCPTWGVGCHTWGCPTWDVSQLMQKLCRTKGCGQGGACTLCGSARGHTVLST
eukprot:358140-Chlamydomonas_euryale.AAC.1